MSIYTKKEREELLKMEELRKLLTSRPGIGTGTISTGPVTSNVYFDPNMVYGGSYAIPTSPFPPGQEVKFGVEHNLKKIRILDLAGDQSSIKLKVGDICRPRCVHPDGEIYLFPASNMKYTSTGRACAEHMSKWRLMPGMYEILEYGKEEPKKIELNPKELERVIMKQEYKHEIIAVLKQYSYKEKMFKDWGLEDTIEYGKGMNFLFHGPPGTGKTWCANCIAKSLGLELLIISAADIQTSEPGGANRNIIQAFSTAAKEQKVLLLDECDSLITVRGDVGMILGSEINTLLTEIEKFEGVCILATNRVDSLDAALERRISLIVEFAEPDLVQREEIWRTLVPKKLPLAQDVDFKKLSSYKLTGGQIKNVIVQAVRMALNNEDKEVGIGRFIQATKRIQSSIGLLGKGSRWSQGIKIKSDLQPVMTKIKTSI